MGGPWEIDMAARAIGASNQRIGTKNWGAILRRALVRSLELGGAALLSPALALLLVASAGLAARRGAVGGARIALHVLSVGLALWTALAAWQVRSNGFMAAALVVGSLAALMSLTLWIGPRAVRSPARSAFRPPQG